MPQHARGAHYFGKVARYMKCPISHEKLADQLYAEILGKDGTGVGYSKKECDNCGTLVVITARYGGEWESQFFVPKPKTETEVVTRGERAL